VSTAIKIENLSKRYRLGVINRDMLYKDLQSRWAKFRGKPDPNAPIGHVHRNRIEQGDEFWALRNINLEIPEGKVFGIIGRNGAGKSTLLKILSQITAPTEGQIKIKGRAASLLEVGTGFHPELTGRENVYLNGAILGMTRKEVRSRFDEIVQFSEIEEFIDTPVKRYSSGMYVRLAFGVAAHLDPEILIVDEVLAVGDAAFQKKCIGKMNSVAGEGRTVILVTHSMALAQSLTASCTWLDSGAVREYGPTQNIVHAYLRDAETAEITANDALHDFRLRRGSGKVRFDGILICGSDRLRRGGFERGEKIVFVLKINVMHICPNLGVLIAFKLGMGSAVHLPTRVIPISTDVMVPGHVVEVEIEIDSSSLPGALYDLYIWAGPLDTESAQDYDIVDSLLPPIEIRQAKQTDTSSFLVRANTLKTEIKSAELLSARTKSESGIAKAP